MVFCGVSCSQSRKEMRPAVFSGGASGWFRLAVILYAEHFLIVAVAVDLVIFSWHVLAMNFRNTWYPSTLSVAVFIHFLMLISLSARE
jgi:hypothetical protein